MSWLDSILEEIGNSQGVLVEGDNDQVFFEHVWQLIANSSERVTFHPANVKRRVIQGIQKELSLIGIVDKDEWPVELVNKEKSENTNLFVLPRFCVENFFCVPEEIWRSLPVSQTRNENFGQFESAILTAMDDWVKHGAMWRVTQRRHSMLFAESDFPKILHDQPVTDENEIKAILRDWADKIDPDVIFQEYENELAIAENLSDDEKLKTYIHGKKFFAQVIVPELNRLFGQKSQDGWREVLTSGSPNPFLPDDLRTFLESLEAYIRESERGRG